MMNYRKLILCILIIGMFLILRDIYKEDNIRLIEEENIINKERFLKIYETNTAKKESNNNEINLNENTINYTKVVKENYKLPEIYMGFKVDSKLEIPKINLETYIFEEYSEKAMNIYPTKLWGPKPNENGNYSIIGHNYQKENMFNNLIDLEIGDEIYLTDNIKGKNEYIVYDIYKVKENNVDPIKQNKEETEITLITCVNYTNNRLIIKAKKVR